MKVWSIQASWILGLLGLLCWVDFVALELLAEQEFLSQQGHDHATYESIGSPYLPMLAAGCLAFIGALLMLVLWVFMTGAEFLGRLIRQKV